jgi:acetyltransferase
MVTPLKPVADSTQDILRSEYHPLKPIFAPQSVAVIGASEKAGSVGQTLLWNLISSPFGGTVFPVNPKRHSVLGIKAYASLKDIPEKVDLAVIATPAPSVPALIQDCVDMGVKGAIIISAGFKEIGEKGRLLEEEIKRIASGKLRIIGPNCLGVMNPQTGLNATFANKIAKAGNVGFISQSGAFCTAVLDWSFPENVGFSAFISIGAMVDVDWGDLIYYLGDDPQTKSIVMYMESIGNARSFLSAAREVALSKPIIIIKAGETEQAAKAAASHTGALTGSDKVLDAAFRRCGVLRVKKINELFDMAEVLGKQPLLPKGSRLTIVTNAGGPGVLATDSLIATGGDLAEISEDLITELNQFLPTQWSHNNPIDILGDADPQRYAQTLQAIAKDPNSDACLVILTPQAMTNPTETAHTLKDFAPQMKKPILASWMGGYEVTEGEEILNQASIPTYRYPDAAAHLFNLLWQYSYNLGGIYETPVLPTDVEGIPDRQAVREILNQVQTHNRTILTESESKILLKAYGIPIVATDVAKTEDESLTLAQKIGYPVVLKLWSETITHKTDVGGVQLNLTDEKAVRWAYQEIKTAVTNKVGAEHFLGVTVQPMLTLDGAYELILGSSIDAQFGPVLLFGTGGQLVEIFKDQAIALPPLNSVLARRMMEQTQIYEALKGIRGRKAVNLAELEQLMVRFSQLIVENPRIQEIDINPLLVSDQRIIALDARVILHPASVADPDLPKPAIRSYPIQYISPWQFTDGTSVTIRPIRPEDEPLIISFHETLSEESVYFRYFHLIKLTQLNAHDRLTRMCFIDYDREMALVADYENPTTGQHQILGLGRLSKQHGMNEAEFAMMVSDRFQKQGLGTELLKQLIKIAKDENLTKVTGEILLENKAMQRVCEKVGFKLKRSPEGVKVAYHIS